MSFSGQLIRLEKYADFLLVLNKKTTVIQGIIDRMTETGRCFGIEEKVVKEIEVKQISRPLSQ